MRFIDKLERKYRKYGIPNLTMYIIGCYVLGYILQMFNPGIMSMLSLEPALILRGQIWRLVTWIISPPGGGGNIIFFAIAILFFYYPIGMHWSVPGELSGIRFIFFQEWYLQ